VTWCRTRPDPPSCPCGNNAAAVNKVPDDAAPPCALIPVSCSVATQPPTPPRGMTVAARCHARALVVVRTLVRWVRLGAHAAQGTRGYTRPGHGRAGRATPRAAKPRESHLTRSTGSCTCIIMVISHNFQGASWQCCQVHYTRNLLGHVGAGRRKELAAALRQVFAASTPAQARAAAQGLADRWRATHPAVARSLEDDSAHLTT